MFEITFPFRGLWGDGKTSTSGHDCYIIIVCIFYNNRAANAAYHYYYCYCITVTRITMIVVRATVGEISRGRTASVRRFIVPERDSIADTVQEKEQSKKHK